MRSTGPATAMVVVAACGLAAAGCASGDAGGNGTRRVVSPGMDRAEASVGSVDERYRDRAPIATAGGDPIGWEAVRERLLEVSGREIVEEVALERALARACRREGVTIGREDLEAERRRLVEAMTSGVALSASEEDAERLLERVRRERGLGPERFGALLRRNAMLRALVAGDVVVEEAAILRMHGRLYGPDYPCRVIVTRTASEASSAVRRVRSGEPFGAVAADVSVDESGARGGIVDPINEADPSWPLALRRTAASLRPGEVSDPVMVEGGYAIVRLDRAPAPKAAPTVDAVRGELERLVRLDRERVLMQELARSLLEEASVNPLDPSLGWSSRGG
jgi:foldase protein PrsA